MRAIVLAASLAMTAIATPTAVAQTDRIDDSDWADIRDTFGDFLAVSVCNGQAGCTVLASRAMAGTNRVVEMAINRYFEAEDQEFANRTGITIRYANGRVITPE